MILGLSKAEQEFVESTVKAIDDKMSWVADKNRDKIPYTTIDGTYDNHSIETEDVNDPMGLSCWTNGFWPGMMWQLFNQTKDRKYSGYAKDAEVKLAKTFDLYLGLHHDVGFMFLSSAVIDYKLTGNEKSRIRGLHAANLLAGRFNLNGRFIRAWNDNPGKDTRGRAIIDCMMNIPLLYWASNETKDPRYKQIALAHADTVLKNFIRDDDSVKHIVEFNCETGEYIKSYGGQGYMHGSSWSRGQAWAVYGFVVSYEQTHEERYLDAAKRVANYFIVNIPDSGIIPIDFRQPAEPALEDSSAAMIAASGFIEIMKNVPVCEKEFYRNAALKLLKTIVSSRTDWSKNQDNIILNSSASYRELTHQYAIVYADYFFIEAIFKLDGSDAKIWGN